MRFVYGIGLPDSRCLVSLKVNTIRISLRDCLPGIPFGTLKLKISTLKLKINTGLIIPYLERWHAWKK